MRNDDEMRMRNGVLSKEKWATDKIVKEIPFVVTYHPLLHY